jgi:hypothetical protein
LEWARQNPDAGYAFLWPSNNRPSLGTWAYTSTGARVVIVGYYANHARDLDVLVTDQS